MNQCLYEFKGIRCSCGSFVVGVVVSYPGDASELQFAGGARAACGRVCER